MKTQLALEELEALRRLDASTLANAIERFHQPLRNEGFVDQTVRCLFPHLKPMLGYAGTIKIRGSNPPTASGIYPERTDWWDYSAKILAKEQALIALCRSPDFSLDRLRAAVAQEEY